MNLTTREVRTAVVRKMFQSRYSLTENNKIQMVELILTVLTQDEQCIALLNAIFTYPTLFNKERVKLLDQVNQLIQVYVPGFTQQINLDQLPNALFVLLSHVSGMPDSFLIEFVQRLRQADMHDESHPYPGRALGSLYLLEVETLKAIQSFWGLGGEASNHDHS